MLGSIKHDDGLKRNVNNVSSFILQGKGMTYMFHQKDLSYLKNFYDSMILCIGMIL